ncbi:hypothetical protein [Streptomyces cylindrosporus]|uniref:Uncharacterized protein n=1 Tax=Streptomyces cylindrosporus TaxID=2927583 RepID=A0ABS9YK75_9ACTN|nr:hypothetical protein [Streptomyces cylindrosporus]MCI3277623.1 hypothetical protein [Streptomyces cylindrosporus]
MTAGPDGRPPGEGLFTPAVQAFHLCVLAGVTSPTAATCTDLGAVALALVACARGRVRPAATLSAAVAASTVAVSLLH